MVTTAVPISAAKVAVATSTSTGTGTGGNGLDATTPLPLVGINHVSFAVPCPAATARFFVGVLGFRHLRRPAALGFDGAWLCGLGLELHLILAPADGAGAPPPRAKGPKDLDPRADHLSFHASDIEAVERKLRAAGVYVRATSIEEEGVLIRQLFLREPSSNILVEISDNPMC